jgi:1-deoxy-D-xylulose-5-phosphate reductoisomerase
VAVEAFLEGRIGFTAIPAIIEAVLDAGLGGRVDRLEEVLAVDAEARALAVQLLPRHAV